MKRLVLLLLCPLLLAMGACSPYWYEPNPQFVVQDSRLNWVQIIYQSAENAPRVRCNYDNSGVITVLEGRSVTVGDDFNIEYEKADFGDVRKYRYTMQKAMFRESLQALVDAGLMKEEKANEETPMYPKILVRANINHHKIEKFVFNETLAAEIRTQLFQFKMSGMLQSP